MSDILLISAPGVSPLKRFVTDLVGMVPLNLASIAAVLIENGFTVSVVDWFHSPPADPRKALVELLDREQPRIIGLSVVTETWSNSVRLARICREHRPGATVVAGGPHVTFRPEEALATGMFDLVVMNEGEYTMLEVANHLFHGYRSLDGIAGLCRRNGDAPHRTGPRPFVVQLDDMPLPARHLFAAETYRLTGAVLSSRGCPFQCIFCSAGAIAGGKYRVRSAEAVMDEVLMLCRSAQTAHIKFLDDTVTANVRRFHRLCDLLEALRPNATISIESRVDVITESMLARMAGLRFVNVQFGVESGDPVVLKTIRKGITLEQVERAVAAASQAGIRTCCSFVLGHPADTVETMRRTIDFGIHLQTQYHSVVLFSIAVPYPGTYMHEHADELGLRLRPINYDDYNFLTPVFETDAFTVQQLRNMQFEALEAMYRNMNQDTARYFDLPLRIENGAERIGREIARSGGPTA